MAGFIARITIFGANKHIRTSIDNNSTPMMYPTGISARSVAHTSEVHRVCMAFFCAMAEKDKIHVEFLPMVGVFGVPTHGYTVRLRLHQHSHVRFVMSAIRDELCSERHALHAEVYPGQYRPCD